MLPLTLTLPHIGGFLLSIGLAVDANILIFERMKEEIRVGRTLASSMEVGFNRAWPAIRDGNLSTLITCGVLLWFGSRLGGGLINGFALSLLVGVLGQHVHGGGGQPQPAPAAGLGRIEPPNRPFHT